MLGRRGAFAQGTARLGRRGAEYFHPRGRERREGFPWQSPCGLARWEVALLALLDGAGPGICGPASAFTCFLSRLLFARKPHVF